MFLGLDLSGEYHHGIVLPRQASNLGNIHEHKTDLLVVDGRHARLFRLLRLL